MFESWRKSSFSGDEGNCVEVVPGAVRDSKNPDAGHLAVSLPHLVAYAKTR